MTDKEKENFREFMKKFSRKEIVGWQCAIAFIHPMDEVNSKLRDKLVEMFNICDDVISEK